MAHLTQEQRDTIYLLHQRGVDQAGIAATIGKHQSTVSRELSRNRSGPRLGYLPDRAMTKAINRRSGAKEKVEKWHGNERLVRYVTEKLSCRERWSPEQISGRLRQDIPGNETMRVCTASIYTFIREDKRRGGILHTFLRNQGRPYRKRGKKEARGGIPNRRDISERPKEAETKRVIGHSESDLVIGLQTGSDALLTIVDRKSKRLTGGKVKRTARSVTEKVIAIMRPLPQELRKTMTHDNGKEISNHQEITEATGMEVFCARPYHSWERGLNEYTNHLVRQYFPKGTDFALVSEEEVQEVYEAINNRPRKCLSYRTPNEVHEREMRKYAFQT
jgi:transposase, IS30 family